jgi:hypothetical protein
MKGKRAPWIFTTATYARLVSRSPQGRTLDTAPPLNKYGRMVQETTVDRQFGGIEDGATRTPFLRPLTPYSLGLLLDNVTRLESHLTQTKQSFGIERKTSVNAYRVILPVSCTKQKIGARNNRQFFERVAA